MNFSLQLVSENNYDKLIIVGAINEDSEVHLANTPANLGNQVLINFRQVTSINSLGVRAWINFMRQLEGKTLVFEECTPEIVNQINMIPSFKGNATISSVYGSFFCDNCNNTQEELFTVGKNFPKAPEFKLDPVKCKNCGHDSMEFEEVEDAYFAFAS